MQRHEALDLIRSALDKLNDLCTQADVPFAFLINDRTWLPTQIPEGTDPSVEVIIRLIDAYWGDDDEALGTLLANEAANAFSAAGVRHLSLTVDDDNTTNMITPTGVDMDRCPSPVCDAVDAIRPMFECDECGAHWTEPCACNE